jgi:bis(5'-nucleosidyl)-tetraphosphatase
MRNQRDRSAGVIVFHRAPDGCRFLLLLSRLTKRPLWEFPKGGVDEGESLLEAALRELEEETGLRQDEVRLVDGFERGESYRFTVGVGTGRALVHKRVTYFLAEALHQEVRISSAEASRHEWLSLPDAMRRVRYPERRRLLEDAARAVGCAVSAPEKK